jgi:outer membrane receptor protein involved in Fe transport
LSQDEFAAHDYSVVSNPTDGGFKRRAQERLSLRLLTGDAIWRTTAYATQGRWQLFLTIPPAGGRFEGRGSQTEEEDSRAGFGATSAVTWSLPRGELTLGAETRWDRSNYQNYFTTSHIRDSAAAIVTGRQLLAAPFAQSHWDLTDRVRLDAGLRYDVFGTRSSPASDAAVSASDGVWSPKVGASVRLTDLFSAYANLSRGFRSPDGMISDPTLAPITAASYEVGLKVGGPSAQASAALFRTDVSNEQTFNPLTLVSSSGGASRRQGLELDWRVPIAGVTTASGDWTFNDARYRSLVAASEDDGSAAVLDGLRVYNTSKFVGSAALDIQPRHMPWRVRLSGNWVGPYSPFDEPGVVLPGYGLAHLGASWSFDRFEVDGTVHNLFDRVYPELVAGGVVSPGRPRTLMLSVRARM